MREYNKFLDVKLASAMPSGIPGDHMLPGPLFPHQAALTHWGLRRGRAAIFADTGLGKMRIELAWSDVVWRHTKIPTLILAPLAVAPQIVNEGKAIGLKVALCQDSSDVRPGINVTNYDRLHLFNSVEFSGVSPDESSVIKHHDAKTFKTLTNRFRDTPFKLPASATPAPNDWTELGTHAEFLGICTQQEMLSEFFLHDGGDTQTWRLKGHARGAFWKWVASWGAVVLRPSDLGFDDSAYVLPQLQVHLHKIDTGAASDGLVFAREAQTLSERQGARRASVGQRVESCAALVNGEPEEAFVVWCNLNDESDALKRAIPGSVEIRGSDRAEDKEARLLAFARGDFRVLISKPSICGWGLNWQHCRRMAFVGVDDSYEAYYQAVRRVWRFGQKHKVHVHLFASDAQGSVLANLNRKEKEADQMKAALSAETRESVMAEVLGTTRQTNNHGAGKLVTVPEFLQ